MILARKNGEMGASNQRRIIGQTEYTKVMECGRSECYDICHDLSVKKLVLDCVFKALNDTLKVNDCTF